MQPTSLLQASLAGVPAFLLYFAGGLAFLAVFAFVYTRVTTHDEVRLIRSGNTAAVPALLGALGGFALPLSKAIAQSGFFLDFVVWAALAFVVQIAAYYVARAVMPDATTRIESGDISAGVWVGGVALTLGTLNAASMTYTP